MSQAFTDWIIDHLNNLTILFEAYKFLVGEEIARESKEAEDAKARFFHLRGQIIFLRNSLMLYPNFKAAKSLITKKEKEQRKIRRVSGSSSSDGLAGSNFEKARYSLSSKKLCRSRQDVSDRTDDQSVSPSCRLEHSYGKR